MVIAMTSTATSSYIPHSSPSGSNKSKVKTKIIKTYHHDICVVSAKPCLILISVNALCLYNLSFAKNN